MLPRLRLHFTAKLCALPAVVSAIGGSKACAEIGEAHADISSGAAEIYGSANASMDAMYIRYVAEECNFEFPIPIELQVDNKTAIAYHNDLTYMRARQLPHAHAHACHLSYQRH